MKKQISFLFILLAISTSAVVAQKSSAILRGGVNLANVSTQSDGTADEANILTTFQVGIIGDLPITSFLYIQPGLLFTGKGSKAQSGEPSDANYFRSEVNPYYIEVPVNLVLKAPIGGGAKFFAGAGPYVAIGIAGNRKLDYKIANVELFWGCNDESIISITAALHAAFACPTTKYLDLDGSFDLAEDVIKSGFILEGGNLRLNGKAGLGLIAN